VKDRKGREREKRGEGRREKRKEGEEEGRPPNIALA